MRHQTALSLSGFVILLYRENRTVEVNSLAIEHCNCASFRITTGSFLSIARAIAICWRSPPESFPPASPAGVSQPCSSREIKSPHCAAQAHQPQTERNHASVKSLNERTESAYFWQESVDWLNALMTC